jgi:hypothetical protein
MALGASVTPELATCPGAFHDVFVDSRKKYGASIICVPLDTLALAGGPLFHEIAMYIPDSNISSRVHVLVSSWDYQADFVLGLK